MFLIVAGRRSDGDAGLRGLWSALSGEVARLGETAIDADRVPSEGSGRQVVLASNADEAVEVTERAIATGSDELALLPLSVAVQQAGAPAAEMVALGRRIADLRARHAGVDLQYIGPPFEDPAAVAAVVDLLRRQEEPQDDLLPATIDRAFGSDLGLFGRFLATLRSGLPEGTKLVLRGSAVVGSSYRSGEPFDAHGPGTSDLDVVVLGDEAMALWLPDAFYFPKVNTLPLYDEARWVAPSLDPARSEAQRIVGRPVAIQAMVPWFLDLRAALQGQPHVVLDAPAT
ncbi:MAG: hypothetical protein QOF11_2625 [Chloroflexota bacterium]|nr:hypothetical protein [Chloroflexota bacterium]